MGVEIAVPANRDLGGYLRGVDWRDAKLVGADLSDAKLNGATYDAETRWPVGFLPPASC